jgi:hypothetical protein
MSLSEMQNPGLAPRASRNQLVGCLRSPLTASESRAQIFASRFCLSPSMARDMAWLCFGECCDD